MAEKMPEVWMKESEFIARQSRINAADILEMKSHIAKLAIVVRDLVYLAYRDTDLEYKTAMQEHLNALGQLCGSDTDE